MSKDLPTNFAAKLDVLQNYTKAPVRIIPSTGQADVKAGDTTIFTLPICVQDLRTFRMNFTGVTGGTNVSVCGFPQFMACMIEQLDIYVNGTSVLHIPYYNQVYKLIKDYSISFEEALLKIGNNADPSVTTDMDEYGAITKRNRFATAAGTNAASLAINTFRSEYVIDDWIGFLGTCEPSIFNTNLVGNFEIHIRWAANNVFWHDAVAGTVEYTISNLYGYIDKIDFTDSSYVDAQASKLSSGGTINIPYKNYRVHLGTTTVENKATTMRITESTQSLDKVIFTYLHGARNTVAPLQLGDQSVTGVLPLITNAELPDADVVTLRNFINNQIRSGKTPPSSFCYEYLKAKNDPNLLNTSQHFRRNGLGMGGLTPDTSGKIQFEINSQDVPSFQLSLLAGYEETFKAFELNEGNLHKINQGIRDLNRYERDFYVVALSTSHINDKRGDYLISGLDTFATSMNIAVKTTDGTRGNQAAQAATPMIISEMSSVMMIGAGREISVKF